MSFAHAVATQQVGHRHSSLGFFQDPDDLALAEFRQRMTTPEPKAVYRQRLTRRGSLGGEMGVGERLRGCVITVRSLSTAGWPERANSRKRELLQFFLQRACRCLE